MPTKRTKPVKSTAKKSTMYKIGGQIGHMAHEVAAGKDHLVEMAGNAIASVKTKVKTVTSKKAAVKKAARPSAKKAAKKSPRKNTAKKAAKK